MQREEVRLDLTPGLLYRTDLRNGCPAGLYRVVGIGRHAHSYQELVALRCEGSSDTAGLWYVNLAAFIDRFKRVAEEPKPVPEKEVNLAEGSGF